MKPCVVTIQIKSLGQNFCLVLNCIIGKGLRESFLNIVYNRGMFRPGDVNFFSCSSVDECKDTLIQFGVQDITPAAVARVVGEEIHLYVIL